MKVIDMIKSSPYYAASSNSIVIHSDEHREQRFNRQECFKKLTSVFRTAGENVIRGGSAKGPPKDLPKPPPGRLSTREARMRFTSQKRTERKAKETKSMEDRIARQKEKKERDRNRALVASRR
ncbi:hypothetical protein ABVK25_007969 [Lepraria finkii]|uniref:Uncharacterized protein n=1 Tax=Lepraria finkii TaxID=1340010 RepID=A0ABR4B343_9LECA